MFTCLDVVLQPKSKSAHRMKTDPSDRDSEDKI